MVKIEAKKRAELYLALSEGKTLETMVHENIWSRLSPENSMKCLQEVNHAGLGFYRVEPENEKFFYRVGLMQFKSGKYFPAITDSDKGIAHFEQQNEFVRWITDKVEYEVPEGES